MKYTKTLNVAIISICIFGIFYLLDKSNKQTKDIAILAKAIRNQNIAKKDSLVNLITQEQFKESFYSTQLSIKSDWTILFITLIFSIFSLVGFFFFQERISRSETDFGTKLKNQSNENENQHVSHKLEFKKLEEIQYNTSANVYCFIAENSKENVEKFIYYINSAYFYMKSFELEDNESDKNDNLTAIIYSISKSVDSIKQIQKINKSDENIINQSYSKIQYNLSELSKMNYAEIRHLCAESLIEINKLYKRINPNALATIN